jgi:hypothetical protein
VFVEGVEREHYKALGYSSMGACLDAELTETRFTPAARQKIAVMLSELGLSQREAAAALGVGKSSVQRALAAGGPNGPGTQSDGQQDNGKPSPESTGSPAQPGGSLDEGGQEKSSETTESDETPAPESVTPVTSAAEQAAAEAEAAAAEKARQDAGAKAEKERADARERKQKERAQKKEKKQAECDHDWRTCGRCEAELEEADRAGAFVLAALAAVGALSEVPAEVRAVVRELAQKAGAEDA